ncbi:sensor histidine kinase [Enterococcus xiangfangensis]|uniref:sensor histidine kinase n=1 Tax=Enterococcus xiangfangensis TaxID=1296537 RepID=UPI0010F6C93A|nr:HAMP domain-containing sensor histidine kinase [Enterococcus xiangfangensis]MBM7712082.1 signal transduction histidine kinase [Enterococcus xiangfangensis]NBK07953.1 sensor histidine kinase [Enterococcus asini]
MQNKREKKRRITLTSKEVSELIAEGIITIILLLLLNVAIMVLFTQMLNNSPDLTDAIYRSKDIFANNLGSDIFWSGRNFVIPFFVIIDVLIIFWRLIRRYHQMQLRHIINELHYIANGNYDYRIPFELRGDLSKVVDSINGLVDSTVAAIEDEREIEKSKDELITNVSHDIRTPLTSIIGYLGLIEDGQYQNDEEILKYTSIAYNKAKQMKSLVEDLFEYSKVRQPSVPVNNVSFDMVQLLEQLAADFELEAKKKNIQIQVETTENQLIMDGDTEKLVRVFNNLITNALKYGADADKIIIEIEKMKNEAVVTVKNNGQPIPREALEQLFDRFYRVDGSRSQEISGTGLGLAIAQNIVNLHGGYIYAQSSDDWTSFIIHLPLYKNQTKSLPDNH